MGKRSLSRRPRSWADLIAGLDPLLDALQACARRPRSAHLTIPREPGVYLFSERSESMYVGQSRNLSKRLANHTNAGARENQATFAFLLALEDADGLGISLNGTRREIAQDPDFAPLFDAAKGRVRAMDVQFAPSCDPELRTVFEVYAALSLPTKYNSFETH